MLSIDFFGVFNYFRDAFPLIIFKFIEKTISKGVNSILEKISEESEEVIQAVKEEGKDEVIHEVADLWFHIMVLLRHEDISIEEIELELARRFGVSGHEEKASRKK